MADTIWKHANDLVQEDSAIIKAPADDTAFMVKSISGQRLHYVKTTKKGGFVCEDQCIGFKSSRVCSHTVAAALKMDTVAGYIQWLSGQKVSSRFTSLSNYGKPQSAGKKPCKGSSKKTSKEVSAIVLNAREEDFHTRSSGESSSMLPQSIDDGSDDQALHSSSSSMVASTSVDEWPLAQHSPVAFSHSPISIHQNYGFNAIGQCLPGPPPLLPVQSLQTAVQSFESAVESIHPSVQPFQSSLQSFHLPA